MAVHLFDGIDIELPDGQNICLSGLTLTSDERGDQILEVLDAVSTIAENAGIVVSQAELKGVAKQAAKQLKRRLDD